MTDYNHETPNVGIEPPPGVATQAGRNATMLMRGMLTKDVLMAVGPK